MLDWPEALVLGVCILFVVALLAGICIGVWRLILYIESVTPRLKPGACRSLNY